MQVLSAWTDALVSSWSQVASSFIGAIPNILGAILIFALGLIIAYWVKRGVMEFLKLIKFEKVSGLSGIDKYLAKAEIKLTLGELIGFLFEWLIILVFFLAVVEILGLSVVSQVLLAVLGYIPNLIAAILIVGTGYLVARLVDNLVRGALVSISPESAKPLGKLAKGIIVVIAVFAGIDQLKVAQGLIATFFQGLTYTIVLAVGLAIGLGTKDLVSKVLTDWYEKIRK